MTKNEDELGLKLLETWLFNHPSATSLQLELACWLQPSQLLTVDKLRDKYRKPNSKKYSKESYTTSEAHIEMLALCGALLCQKVKKNRDIFSWSDIQNIFQTHPFNAQSFDENSKVFIERGITIWNSEFGDSDSPQIHSRYPSLSKTIHSIPAIVWIGLFFVAGSVLGNRITHYNINFSTVQHNLVPSSILYHAKQIEVRYSDTVEPRYITVTGTNQNNEVATWHSRSCDNCLRQQKDPLNAATIYTYTTSGWWWTKQVKVCVKSGDFATDDPICAEYDVPDGYDEAVLKIDHTPD